MDGAFAAKASSCTSWPELEVMLNDSPDLTYHAGPSVEVALFPASHAKADCLTSSI